jgi:hypothetical protein
MNKSVSPPKPTMTSIHNSQRAIGTKFGKDTLPTFSTQILPASTVPPDCTFALNLTGKTALAKFNPTQVTRRGIGCDMDHLKCEIIVEDRLAVMDEPVNVDKLTAN